MTSWPRAGTDAELWLESQSRELRRVVPVNLEPSAARARPSAVGEPESESLRQAGHFDGVSRCIRTTNHERKPSTRMPGRVRAAEVHWPGMRWNPAANMKAISTELPVTVITRDVRHRRESPRGKLHSNAYVSLQSGRAVTAATVPARMPITVVPLSNVPAQ